jgi:NTP pyrophosphatase (non-canonical NTP hydrolase)
MGTANHTNSYQTNALRTEGKTRVFIQRPSDPQPVEINSRLLHAMLGMVTEAGEVADILKKFIFYGRDYTRDKVKDEIGDLLWYSALGASAIDELLSEVMDANIRKLRARYEAKFTELEALNRNPQAEERALIQEGDTMEVEEN